MRAARRPGSATHLEHRYGDFPICAHQTKRGSPHKQLRGRPAARTAVRAVRPRVAHVTDGRAVPLYGAGLVPMTTVASSSSEPATRAVSPLRATVSTVCGACRSLVSTSR